jgi:hypothetical protein
MDRSYKTGAPLAARKAISAMQSQLWAAPALFRHFNGVTGCVV